MSPRNHADCVGNYCDAVLSGEIIAGRYVQLAVERHLDDLEHPGWTETASKKQDQQRDDQQFH